MDEDKREIARKKKREWRERNREHIAEYDRMYRRLQKERFNRVGEKRNGRDGQ